MTKLQRLISREEDWQKRLGPATAKAEAKAAATVDLTRLDTHLESILASSGKDLASRSPQQISTVSTSCCSSLPSAESEIVVRIDDMDLDDEIRAGGSTSVNHIPDMR